MLFVLDDPYGTECGLGALRSLGRKLMKGLIWKQLSLRIKASGKCLYIIVSFPLDHHSHVFSFTWTVWQMSPLKGTSQQSSLSRWYDVSCFPVCQLLWPLRDAFWRHELWQDEVMAPCKRAGKLCFPSCMELHTLYLWSRSEGFTPFAISMSRDQLLGVISLPVAVAELQKCWEA